MQRKVELLRGEIAVQRLKVEVLRGEGKLPAGGLGVILSLNWSGAEIPLYSALISGFEHLLGIILDKNDFQRHFSIISLEFCFFSWI